jgi:hypothetical protein
VVETVVETVEQKSIEERAKEKFLAWKNNKLYSEYWVIMRENYEELCKEEGIELPDLGWKDPDPEYDRFVEETEKDMDEIYMEIFIDEVKAEEEKEKKLSKVDREVKQLIKTLELNCKIGEFKNKVDWCCISRDQKLSEDFIREFKNRVDWDYISSYQNLSEGFIREFKDKVFWDSISRSQKLSEDFIREFKNKVIWYYITRCQNLSENFIRKFKNRVCWSYIPHYQNVSENFVRRFKGRIDKSDADIYFC